LSDQLNPIIAVKPDLVSVDAASEPSGNQCLFVAVRTENGQILRVVIRRVIVDVMNLDSFVRSSADAAGSVASK
jgi:hypothetical protein